AQHGYPYFPVQLLHQLMQIVKHLEKVLPGITLPVQLMQAKDDDVASVKNSIFIYERLGSKMKEMIFLYNSYHLICVDHERDIVADKMEDFFKRAKEQWVNSPREFKNNL
ncbi:MAG: alpha/beta hydrolase, partial [Candidatus Omnitrophica bacterium]|nr:alpha/beta hydrolase [Candidatus Omnitrophota bacterium]